MGGGTNAGIVGTGGQPPLPIAMRTPPSNTSTTPNTNTNRRIVVSWGRAGEGSPFVGSADSGPPPGLPVGGAVRRHQIRRLGGPLGRLVGEGRRARSDTHRRPRPR